MLWTDGDLFLVCLTQRYLILLHIFDHRKYEKTSHSNFETCSAANADNVSNTVTITTASEALLSLVRSAISRTHVIPLVPDLSLAGGIGHGPVLTVPIMVVPRPDLKLGSTLGLKNIASGPRGPPPHSIMLQFRVPSPRWSPPSGEVTSWKHGRSMKIHHFLTS